MNAWLDEDLKNKIKKVFEPRYQRRLSESEIVIIARNLTIFMENVLRFKCKKYEKKN